MGAAREHRLDLPQGRVFTGYDAELSSAGERTTYLLRQQAAGKPFCRLTDTNRIDPSHVTAERRIWPG